MNKYIQEFLRIFLFSCNSALSFRLISSTYGASRSSNSSILSLDIVLRGSFLSSNGILGIFFFGILNIKKIFRIFEVFTSEYQSGTTLCIC